MGDRRALRGAAGYLLDGETPLVTEAAQAMVDLAKSGGGPI